MNHRNRGNQCPLWRRSGEDRRIRRTGTWGGVLCERWDSRRGSIRRSSQYRAQREESTRGKQGKAVRTGYCGAIIIPSSRPQTEEMGDTPRGIAPSRGHTRRIGMSVRHARCSKRLSSKAAASEGPEAYPLGYVEDPERCENEASDEARLDAPGRGGWEKRLFQHLAQTSGICQSIGASPASARSRLMCEKHRQPKNFLTDKGEGCAHATTAWCDCVINLCFF